MSTSIGIHGAAGRMGQRLIALSREDSQLQLVAALERAGHPQLGQDAGTVAGVGPLGLELATTWPQKPRVMIDFSLPQGTRDALRLCRAEGVALVIGTTGLSQEDHLAIDEAARDIAVLQSPNMSLGVNLLFALAGTAAAKLGQAYDIEIVEAHHRFKQDAPSGTALGLAQAINHTTGRGYSYTPPGEAPKPARPGDIAIHALRLGDVVGRHTVHLATLGEEIQLTHIASTRDIFARGALEAAKWLAGQGPGRYHMKDVLGL
ncbi:MAG TPA: 4-hydroxy-tetrahydrodipicolinate reductase [Phycisphaeraceae bacterium]